MRTTRPAPRRQRWKSARPAFLALIGESPEIAEAAALGERVITLGPDGWVTLVWPEVATAE